MLAQDVTWGGLTGDAVHLRELAEQLAKRGNAVRVIARGGGTKRPGDSSSVEFHALHASLDLAFSFVRRPLTVSLLLRVGSNRKPDVVYSRSFGDFAEAITASVLGVPIVYEVNGDAIAEREALRSRAPSWFLRRWAASGARRGFHRARSVVPVTDTLRRRLIQTYRVPDSKIRVVENSADTTLFQPSDARRARSILELPDGLVLLFVGNLAPWQGVDYLLRAFEVLSHRHPRTHLVIVGDGQARPRLQRLASELVIGDRVHFTGAVPYERVPLFVAASDLCVAPMTRERLKSGSSAIKVQEYLACERPVVASRIPGLEFLETEDLGILVPPEDVEALASAIGSAFVKADWRQSAGVRGRAFVLRKSSWASVAEAVEDVCRKAAIS